MKKLVIIVSAITMVFAACEKDKGYYLSGNTEGFEDGTKVYISELGEDTRAPKVVDTAVIKNGHFEVDLEDTDVPNLGFLRFEGSNGSVLFIEENQKISFDINKDSIQNAKVSGGKENAALNEYMGHLKDLNQKYMKLQADSREAMMKQDTAALENMQATQMELRDNDKVKKEEIFKNNKDSFVGLMVLTDMLNMKTHSATEVKKMYEELSDRIKQTPLAKKLKENLDQMSATDVGNKAPEFSGPNPEGKEISLSENMGKVTIVDFWAAWCKPCRAESPNLVKVYNKYKDQGLNIISVSLDRPGQKDKWVEAIKEDNLGAWNHVSHLEFWKEPIARKYGVTAIPATYILDDQGVIVAKNLRGDDLSNKIGELLSKS
ncbi:peroxiredoxin [Christiangramia fulva]|uniref:Peroxiredoxin n=1 Tax=Christiangramia fulva TaxID=2126553 RepID=A0A2R3Z9H1_9FLAO|nr:TlpA disulfide reductase family protein [Christiangramia fulva]AVR46929.1 peroxiredoxin [Christiangramia fulva]